ncbi:hypothetical protein SVAN01_09367 [Stagonosporopsis vannaccii]|nr:hypothetical protein SVAN01_09367 [Stagonosporopsis vannaccii]
MHVPSPARDASATEETQKRSRRDSEGELSITLEVYNIAGQQERPQVQGKPAKRRRFSSQSLGGASQTVKPSHRNLTHISKSKAEEYLRLIAPLRQARQTRAVHRNQTGQIATSQLVWRKSTNRPLSYDESDQHQRSTVSDSCRPSPDRDVAASQGACNESIASIKGKRPSEKAKDLFRDLQTAHTLWETSSEESGADRGQARGRNNTSAHPIPERVSSCSLYSNDTPIIVRERVSRSEQQDAQAEPVTSGVRDANVSTAMRAGTPQEVISKLSDIQQAQRKDTNRQDERLERFHLQIEEQYVRGQVKTEECLQNIKFLQDHWQQVQDRANLQLTTLVELQQRSFHQQDQLEHTVTTNNQQIMLRTNQLELQQRQLRDLLLEGFQHVVSRHDQCIVNNQELSQRIETFASHLEKDYNEGGRVQEKSHHETQLRLQALYNQQQEAHSQQDTSRKEYHADLMRCLEAIFQCQKDWREQSHLAHEGDREMPVAIHQVLLTKLSEISDLLRLMSETSETPQQEAVHTVDKASGNDHRAAAAPKPCEILLSPSHVAGLASRVQDLEERAAASQSAPEAVKAFDHRSLLERVQELEAGATLYRTQQAEVYLSRIADCAESLAGRDSTATHVSEQIDALTANILRVSSRVTANDVDLATLTRRVGAIDLQPQSTLETTNHRFEELQRSTKQLESQLCTKINVLQDRANNMGAAHADLEATFQTTRHEQSVRNENFSTLIRELGTALDDHVAHQQRLHAEVRSHSAKNGQEDEDGATKVASASGILTHPETGARIDTNMPIAEDSDGKSHFSTALSMPFTPSQYLDCIKLLEYRLDLLQIQNQALTGALEGLNTRSSRFKRAATGIAADFRAIEQMRETIGNIKNSASDSDVLLQGANEVMDMIEKIKNDMSVSQGDTADGQDEEIL